MFMTIWLLVFQRTGFKMSDHLIEMYLKLDVTLLKLAGPESDTVDLESRRCIYVRLFWDKAWSLLKRNVFSQED